MMTALISDKQNFLSDYHDQGFCILPQFFTAQEIQAVSLDADRVFQEWEHLKSVRNIRCRWQDNVFTGECQFDAFDPIIDLSPATKTLTESPKLLAVLAAIYGEPACLFKDKLIFKLPGAKGYALHQDWIAWERFPRSFLSVLVPLDFAGEENGCTVVYPGYHQDGPMSTPDGNYHELSMDLVDESKAVPLILNPGDIAIFGGFTPHRSNANVSDQPRRQLYLSYTKYSDGGELRDRHYQDFHEWLEKKYREYGKKDTYFA